MQSGLRILFVPPAEPCMGAPGCAPLTAAVVVRPRCGVAGIGSKRFWRSGDWSGVTGLKPIPPTDVCVDGNTAATFRANDGTRLRLPSRALVRLSDCATPMYISASCSAVLNVTTWGSNSTNLVGRGLTRTPYIRSRPCGTPARWRPSWHLHCFFLRGISSETAVQPKMADNIESSRNATAKETINVEEPHEKPAVEHGVLVDKEGMNDAFKGESLEHSMGPWEAAKSHPMACFWAFFMCFTIVSP